MPFLLVIVWPLMLASVAAGAMWVTVGLRVRRILHPRPTIRAGLDLPAAGGDAPLVSVIVPVHDEERVIDACATSLRAQDHPALQIVFVLDRCTDGTADILERHRADDPRVKLVTTTECPDGWAGKCNAAHAGAEAADGDYVLFTDADTVFDPRLVRASVALACDRDLGLLSLLSTLTTEHMHERIAQPVATMHLVRMYPIDRVNRRVEARPFANGQFMLFDRTWYDRIGGHAAVRNDLLEDIAFARRLRRHGGHGGLFLADEMLHCSMYESLAAFRTGWKRIFIEACKRRPTRLLKNGARVVMGGVLLPALQFATLLVGVALVLGDAWTLGAFTIIVALLSIGLALRCLVRIFGLGGAPPSSALLFPVGSWIVAAVMFDGARDLWRRRPIAWGGREYVLEPRTGPRSELDRM
jgi:chlorobactene glucosyltransferase